MARKSNKFWPTMNTFHFRTDIHTYPHPYFMPKTINWFLDVVLYAHKVLSRFKVWVLHWNQTKMNKNLDSWSTIETNFFMSLPKLSTKLTETWHIFIKEVISKCPLTSVEIQIWTDFRTIALHHYPPLCVYTILVVTH